MKQLWVETHEMAEMLEKAPMLAAYPFTVRHFTRGERLVRCREPLRTLSFLASGRVKVFRVMENGRSVLHSVFEGLAVIGDLEFLLGYPAATTDICAMTDGVLLEIPLASCAPQLLQDVEMLCFLGRELAKKLERSSRMGAQNSLYPLSARLAAYLLFSAQDGCFAENLTQTSEVLATGYRHLLRTLKAFCDAGYIVRCKQGYRIAQEDALRKEGASIMKEEA